MRSGSRYIVFYCFVFAAAISFVSCEKAIDFTPDATEPALVVEAIIENDEYPLVSLSSSFDFFSKISFDMLAASFVHDAEIMISNGTLTHRLKEYEIPLAGDYKLYYYSIDSSDMATAFKGEFGGAYSMTIKSAGKEYTSSTTIPYLLKRIESLSWETVKNQPDSSLVILYGETTDPPGRGNYIRYFTSTNGG
ncbi:MAG: DUF4249 family protein, partial [Flavitalea sp.]